jgi:outer membrane murein-binding lipoprotein Lpp
VTAADWIGIGALAGAPTLAFVGVVYRAGQLTSSVRELAAEVARLRTRVDSLESWMRERPRR